MLVPESLGVGELDHQLAERLEVARVLERPRVHRLEAGLADQRGHLDLRQLVVAAEEDRRPVAAEARGVRVASRPN
ncbi:MAG: hypothetical protein ACREMB_15960 [Candidatus Rokuibacteriota bacterium]